MGHFHIQNTRTHTHNARINRHKRVFFALVRVQIRVFFVLFFSFFLFSQSGGGDASTTTDRFSALFVSSAFPQSDDTTPKGNTKENDDTNTSALSSSSSSSFSFSKDAIDSASITIGSTAFAHFVTAFPAFADEGLEAAPGVLD